jgi:hypothetical protein
MARQNIPVTRPTSAGVNSTAAEVVPVAVDDLSFVNDGQTFLVLRNTTGVPDTATVITPATPGGLALADQPIVVAANATYVAGPFPPQYFNQVDGTVQVDVTTAALRFTAFSMAT